MGASPRARMSWTEICASTLFRDRWLALDDCRYDGAEGHPSEATVIDADDDLTELCSRMKRASRRSCAILFCAASHLRRDSRAS